MSRNRLAVLFALLLLATLTMTACNSAELRSWLADAQSYHWGAPALSGDGDAQPLTQAYSAGGLSVRYPDGWAAGADAMGLFVANSAEALQRVLAQPEADPAPHDFVLLIFDPVQLAGLAEGDQTPHTFLATLAAHMMTGGTTIGPIHDAQVGPYPGAQAWVSDARRHTEGFLLAWDQDGVLLFMVAAGYTGEADEHHASALRIAESVRYQTP